LGNCCGIYNFYNIARLRVYVFFVFVAAFVVAAVVAAVVVTAVVVAAVVVAAVVVAAVVVVGDVAAVGVQIVVSLDIGFLSESCLVNLYEQVPG
jgi:hypothetical protein